MHKVSFSGQQDVEMSRHEMKQLTKSFEQEDFRGLLSEYVKEISDPDGRKEQLEYMEELEKKNEIPPGMKLLKPTVGFCIKTTIWKYGSNRTKKLPQKCFVNICNCPDIASADSSGPKGQWSIPHVVGAGRTDQDKNGNICTTFDALLHPNTVKKCEENAYFMEMVVNICIESMIKHHKNSGDIISKD